MSLSVETSKNKLLIVASQSLPTDQLDSARTVGWYDDVLDSNTEVMGRNIFPSLSEWFYRKLKLDVPLALETTAKVVQFKPDVIFANNEAAGLPLAFLNRFGLFGDSKLVILNHNPMSDGPMGIKNWLTNFGRWDVMVCLSAAEAERFMDKSGLSSNQVKSSILPYNVRVFRPIDDEQKLAMSPYALSMGVSKRDYPTLVESSRQLDDLEFRIDPSSPSDPLLGPDWQQNLPQNVQLVHYSNPAEHNKAVEEALFVTLSIEKGTPQKDAGCTLIQAGASAGIPAVAATEGLQSYLLDGLTGIIVEPGNSEALTEALDEMNRNHSLRTKMGKNAREFALETFTPEAHTKRMQAIIYSLGN